MKYTATTTECHSPKSPEVVLFFPLDILYDRMDTTHLNRPQSNSNENSSESGVSSGYIEHSEDNSSTDDSTRRMSRPAPTPGFEHIHGRSLRKYDVDVEGERSLRKPRRRAGVVVPKLVCGVLVFLLVCLTASTFALMFVMWGKYNDLKREIENVHVTNVMAQQDAAAGTCLPCHELEQGPFAEDNPELRKLVHRVENGSDVCCAHTPTQISILLNLFAKRKQLEKCALDKISEKSGKCNSTSAATPAVPSNVVSAHLLAGRQPSTNTDHEQPIKQWLTDRPGTHLQGLVLSDNRLVVPETGLYFLYSQAGFLVYYDKGNVSKASQSIFHKVFRYQVIYPENGGSQELLRSEITQCWEPDKQYGRYTSYIGASVHLNKNDQLYVSVSRISQLSSDPKITYFGLYKIN